MDLADLGLESVIVPSQHFVNQFLIPELVGATLALVLSGMCIPNILAYYIHFPKDNLRNKAAVTLVALGVLLYIVLQLHFVIRLGSTRAHTLKTISGSDTDSSLLSVAYIVVALPCQIILSERAWKLNNRNKLLGVWLALLIVASFGASVATMCYTFIAKENVFADRSALFITIPVSLISYLAIDLSIVMGILVGLHRTSKGLFSPGQSRSNFGGTRLIKAVLQTSVEAAVFPTILNIVTLALHYYRRTGVIFTTPSFLVTPIYCLTLLYSLDRRRTHIQASQFHPTIPTSLLAHQPTSGIPPPTISKGTQKCEDSVSVVFSGGGHSEDTHRGLPTEDKSKTLSYQMRVSFQDPSMKPEL